MRYNGIDSLFAVKALCYLQNSHKVEGKVVTAEDYLNLVKKAAEPTA